MPTFPRRGRPAQPPPPPPSPPHKGPRGRPPFPPPPKEEHPPGHPHANVTHYELPTLLTADNANATLKVAVVAYRLGPGDKGPVKRSVVVFPQRPEHHHDHHEHEHEDKEKMMCPRQDPFSPIKAIFADFPARSGAIHVSFLCSSLYFEAIQTDLSLSAVGSATFDSSPSSSPSWRGSRFLELVRRVEL